MAADRSGEEHDREVPPEEAEKGTESPSPTEVMKGRITRHFLDALLVGDRGFQP